MNHNFLNWLNKKYGEHKQVGATRGQVHEYLGMSLDYSKKGKIIIATRDYVQDMLEDFSVALLSNATPAGIGLFGQYQKDKPVNWLSTKMKEEFHIMTAKALFRSTRGRPDIQPTVAYLCKTSSIAYSGRLEKADDINVISVWNTQYGADHLRRTTQCDEVLF